MNVESFAEGPTTDDGERAGRSLLQRGLRRIKHVAWTMNGRWGRSVDTTRRARLTVLITYYDPQRLADLAAQAQNVLRCRFVERLVLSSHNPGVRLEPVARLEDPRVIYVQQDRPRGCGHRWAVARSFPSDYYLVLDDDLRLFPWQIRRLFEHLAALPERPHGLAGMVRTAPGGFDYHQSTDREVDYLCECYAVSAAHLERYHRLAAEIEALEPVANLLESAVDFALLSRTGTAPPLIHDVGAIFRGDTFKRPGVAIHTRPDFGAGVEHIHRVLTRLTSAYPEDGHKAEA